MQEWLALLALGVLTTYREAGHDDGYPTARGHLRLDAQYARPVAAASCRPAGAAVSVAALVVALLGCAFIIFIGARFLLAPRVAIAGYGVPPTVSAR